MSTIIIIGGGPHPNARIVGMQEVSQENTVTNLSPTITWAIFDGVECLGTFERLSFAKAILPLIQSGQ